MAAEANPKKKKNKKAWFVRVHTSCESGSPLFFIGLKLTLVSTSLIVKNTVYVSVDTDKVFHSFKGYITEISHITENYNFLGRQLYSKA